MTLLSPLGLAWLGSLPVLIWLWRFAASQHQTSVPSLVPFEHLLRRSPKRRTYPIVNWLFWLQLAALALLALALASPAVTGHQPRTTLVLLDTSASMNATVGGPSPFQQAARYLSNRIARKGLQERFFLVTTAPVTALSAAPLSDEVQLREQLRHLAPADLAGDLSTAHRIAQALLGARADETMILTDEPAPQSREPHVEVRSFGTPLPNVAIVGLDAHEPLCLPSETQLLVTVQNFADHPQSASLTVRHDGRTVVTQPHALDARSRVPISVTLPEGSEGLFEVAIQAERDALSVDNRAFVTLKGHASIHVVVAWQSPDTLMTIGKWLDACSRLAWQSVPPVSGSPQQLLNQTSAAETILITDRPELAESWPSPSLAFAPTGADRHPTPTQWIVDPTHPIGEYLEPLVTIGSAPSSAGRGKPENAVPGEGDNRRGEPVIWGVVEGSKIPLVRAASTQGWRNVQILMEPAALSSTPSVLVFLNSLRWLTGSLSLLTTGEPIIAGPFEPGAVRIRRPNGVVEPQSQGGGMFRYDSTDQAGRYTLTQGHTTVDRVVNFLDPLESNTMTRVSTWQPVGEVSSTAPVAQEKPDHSLADWLVRLMVAVLLLEWLLYSRKNHRKSTVSP